MYKRLYSTTSLFLLNITTLIGAFSILIVGWEVMRLGSNQILLPSSKVIVTTFAELVWEMSFFKDLLSSLIRVICSLILAILFAAPLGVFVTHALPGAKSIAALIEIIRPIPPIACLPIAVAIFGASSLAANAIIFLGAFFPIFTNVRDSYKRINCELINEYRQMEWTALEKIKLFILPVLMPGLLTGISIGLGTSWMCVVAAEMLGVSSGLGYKIDLNRQLLRFDRVIGYIISLAMIGALSVKSIGLLRYWLVPWEYSSKKTIVKRGVTQIFASENLLSQNKVDLVGVNFFYPETGRGVRDINLSLLPGRIRVIMGPSGCGKSTLLRLIAGFLIPNSGRILSNKESMNCRSVALFNQQPAFFPWLNCYEQILWSLPKRLRTDENVQKLIEKVGLEGLSDRYPGTLSGGQRQRLSLARALAFNRSILLLDEPFSNLDLMLRRQLQNLIKEIAISEKLTVCVVTHDIEEALNIADEVTLFSSTGSIIDELSREEIRAREESVNISLSNKLCHGVIR